MYCRYCGVEMYDTDKYCPKCGREQVQYIQQMQYVQQAGTGSSALEDSVVGIVKLLGLFAIGFIVVCMFMGGCQDCGAWFAWDREVYGESVRLCNDCYEYWDWFENN